MAKMVKCKTCNEEISANAKTCPKCGAKNSKPIYKKPWFIALVVIVLIAVIASLGGNDKTDADVNTADTSAADVVASESETAAPVAKEYIPVTTDDLFGALKGNALNAANTYKGTDLEIRGRLTNIDASGSYIDLGNLDKNNYEYMFDSVQCYITNDDQKNVVAGLSTDQTVIVKGHVKDVGEILGYSVSIDEIYPA